MTKTKLIKKSSGMEVEKDGKSYPVRSEDEISLKKLARNTHLKAIGDRIFTDHDLDKALSQGIEIPNERVIVKEFCEYDSCPEKGCCENCYKPTKYATLLTEDKEGEGAYIYLVYDSDRSSVLSAHLTEESANKQSLELRKGFAPSVTYDIQKVEILK